MPEPASSASFVAGALASGAATFAQCLIRGAASDAYSALKAGVAKLASSDVETLEKRAANGDSLDARTQALAETLSEQPNDVLVDLQRLAEALNAALPADNAAAVNIVSAPGGFAAVNQTISGDAVAGELNKGASRARTQK